MPNSCPPSNPSATPPPSPARQHFLQRLDALSIKPTTHEYYVRWAEAWNKALGHRSAERTHAFFDALGRTTHLADWQFLGGGVGVPPAVLGILPNTLLRKLSQRRILAHEILTIPWAATYDWQGLADQAHSLGAVLLIHHRRQKPRRCLDPHNLTLPDHHLGRGATA